ncbi:PorP/SprF family type IX secretion system membrane protein [Chondrinema litorale]|uniref:PorP/SprF family type IX secretion system membrane protein n=1 Tax=Chondrinema litorale TaxID=2994555 RepID=UPI0025429C03|nr:PorP/SprF family type IX secretion system membrane protein [Chondrinema litorale]UZR94762.1 PorP/SprF family type IX secretion system membrane protein [Chondrinema litorale]
MNTIYKKIFFAVTFAIVSLSACAQNVFFSQYLNSPVYHNPSLVGVTDYTSVVLNYRSQYIRSGSRFDIPSVSFMHPFFRENGSKLGGIGVSVISEDEGNGILNTTGGTLSFAYNIPLSKRNLISVGVQPGFFNRKVKTSGMTTDSQYINGGFDESADINESFSDINMSYFSVSSGITWNYLDAEGKQLSFLGVAMYNMNSPVNSFLNDDSELPVSFVTSGGVTVYQKSQLSIMPTFRWINQDDYNQVNLGAMFKYQLGAPDEDCHVGLGAWYSLDNASIFLAEAGFKNYMVGFSYDASTSQRYESNPTNNAFEVTLSWRKSRKKTVTTPEPLPETLVTEEVVEEKVEEEPVVEKVVLGVKGKVTDAKTQSAVSGVTIKMSELGSADVIETYKVNANGTYQFKPEESAEYTLKVKAPNYQEKTVVIDYKGEDMDLDIQLDEIEKDTKFDLENIYFETGSFNLAEDSKVELEKLVSYMKENPGIKVEIGGHTDSVGSASSNEKLSLNRAKAVFDMMVEKGIAGERLTYVGYGESKPIVVNDTKENQAKNRRIEFIIK